MHLPLWSSYLEKGDFSFYSTLRPFYFKVGEIGLATAYIGNERIRKLVWHILSLAHVPLDRHHEAEQVIQAQVDAFSEEVVIF